MKIRLSDIPTEGLSVEFPLELDPLNARVDPSLNGKFNLGPEYSFPESPTAELKVTAETRTVYVDGHVSGIYRAPCSRCAEETKQRFKVPVRMVLKPHSERARPDEEVEDLQLGYYDGHEFDTDPVAQEFVILGLPYKVLCSADCRGLCPHCGKNLNDSGCECALSEPGGDDRFAVLKQLKLQ